MLKTLQKAASVLGEEARNVVRRTRNGRRLMQQPFPTGATPYEVVLQRNKMKLLAFDRLGPEQETTRRPVLIVPSLINRYYILDLQKGKSFVEYLSQQGFPVYVVDWGTPGPEDAHVDFSELVDSLVHASVRKVCELHQQDSVHLVGHCVGGMVTLTYAALYPERVKTLLNLTTPVDIRQGGILRRWTSPEWMDPDLVVDAFGNAPWPLLQASFHMLVPLGLLMKSWWIYEQLPNDNIIENIRAMETWSNDNVSLPGEFFRTFIREIYQKNGLYEGTFSLDGRKVDLRKLQHPTMNVWCKADHIAPPASVAALKDLMPQTQNIEIPGGHVSVVASSRAVKTVWPQISQFFQGAA
ncbi:MAG: alpha/beta fold hydrolase [Myxococcales bacterium]|nr:alpha/beta fold hydrolase [Myxococcales bacterium]